MDTEKAIPQEAGLTSSSPLSPPPTKPEEPSYPPPLQRLLILSCLFTALFAVSLDKLIISTAVPAITDAFDSSSDVGWYGTSYLLTNCAFQLVFGRLYTLFDIKKVFLLGLLLFEVGSTLCGAAPSSLAFILGRALAGLGGGGIQAGNMVIMTYTVPLQDRPKYQGLMGAIFGISSVLGPLVGGAFTTNVTWRWCFYINLPIGAVVAGVIIWLLDIKEQEKMEGEGEKGGKNKQMMSLKEKAKKINILGSLVLVAGVVCLCLALQWGGTKYPWSQPRIIALLVVAFVLLSLFVALQILQPDLATVPPHIFKQRSVLAGFWATCCQGSHMQILVFFLPIWLQAIKGKNAVGSGTALLAMVLPMVFSTVTGGFLVSKIGYYTPFLILGVCLAAVGTGLLTTLTPESTAASWAGFQVIYGLGLGFSVQGPNMAAQTVLPRKEVAIGASLMFFGQTLFGAVFISAGQNILDTQLVQRLAGGVVPGVDADLIQSTGTTTLLDFIPDGYMDEALKAYNASLRTCFQAGLIMACLGIFGALAMEWRSVKKGGKGEGDKN